MDAEPDEIKPRAVKKSEIAFIDDDAGEDFHGELPIKDAEITSETRTAQTKFDDDAGEDFLTQFLASFPDTSNISFVVTRQPDKHLAGNFQIPCDGQSYTDTIYWTDESEPSDLYDEITRKHGGGRYTIQARTGAKGFQKNKSWTINLADPPQPSERLKTLLTVKTKTAEEQQQQQPAQNPVPQPDASHQPPKSAIKQALEELEDFQKLQKIFTPPALTTAPPPIAAPPQVEPVTTDSVKWRVLDKALNFEPLVEKALNGVLELPPETVDAGSGSVVIDTVKFVWAHPEETKTVLDMALSSLSSVAAKLFSPSQPKPQMHIVRQPIQPAQNPLEQFRRPKVDAADAPTLENGAEAQSAPETTGTATETAADFPIITLV